MEDERELDVAAKDLPDRDEWYDEAKRLREVYRQLEEEERELLFKYWYRKELEIRFDAWFLSLGISSSDWRRQMRAIASFGRFGLAALLPDEVVQRLVSRVLLQVRDELDEGLRGAVWHAYAHGDQGGLIKERLGYPVDAPEFQLLLDACANSDWKHCPECAELLIKTDPGSGLYSAAQARLRGDRGASCDGYYRERMSADDAEVVEARARAELDGTESRR